MSIQLYKIADQYEHLLSQLYDPDTGEINQEIAAQLEITKDEGNEKVISVAAHLKNVDAERKAVEEAKKEIAARESRLEREVDFLHFYIKSNMERCGISEIKCPYFVVKIRKNRSAVDDYDPSAIPEEYKRTTIDVKTDKNKIREQLEAGVIIPGARLKQSTSLIIR